MNERVDIRQAVPESIRIYRGELMVGDVVFDVWGNRYDVLHVRHYKASTVGMRSDGIQFRLYDDQTITVIRK